MPGPGVRPLALQASAITYFVGFFALVQIVLGLALLGRRPLGPVRLFAALLFILNGLASVGQAARFVGLDEGALLGSFVPESELPWALPLLQFFDDPTGIVLCLLAWATSRGVAASTWPPLSKRICGLVLLVAFGFAAYRAIAPTDPAVARALLVSGPVYVGYSALVVVLGRQVVRAKDHVGGRIAAFLFAGFAMRGAEFSVIYPVTRMLDWGHWTGVDQYIDSFLSLALIPAILVSLVLVGRHGLQGKGRGDAPKRVAFASLVAGLLLGLVVVLGESGERIEYVLSVFSLYVVRPILVGEALLPGASTRTLGGVALIGGAWIAVKLALAALFGADPFALSALDLVAVALVLLAIPFLGSPTTVREVPPPAVSEEFTPTPPLARALPGDRSTAAQRILAQLAAHFAADPDGPGLTANELGDRAGVSPKVVGREVQRAERLLRMRGEEGASLLQTRKQGVRGRHYYRLTAAGSKAAADRGGVDENTDRL